MQQEALGAAGGLVGAVGVAVGSVGAGGGLVGATGGQAGAAGQTYGIHVNVSIYWGADSLHGGQRKKK